MLPKLGFCRTYKECVKGSTIYSCLVGTCASCFEIHGQPISNHCKSWLCTALFDEENLHRHSHHPLTFMVAGEETLILFHD